VCARQECWAAGYASVHHAVAGSAQVAVVVVVSGPHPDQTGSAHWQKTVAMPERKIPP